MIWIAICFNKLSGLPFSLYWSLIVSQMLIIAWQYIYHNGFLFMKDMKIMNSRLLITVRPFSSYVLKTFYLILSFQGALLRPVIPCYFLLFTFFVIIGNAAGDSFDLLKWRGHLDRELARFFLIVSELVTVWVFKGLKKHRMLLLLFLNRAWEIN